MTQSDFRHISSRRITRKEIEEERKQDKVCLPGTPPAAFGKKWVRIRVKNDSRHVSSKKIKKAS